MTLGEKIGCLTLLLAVGGIGGCTYKMLKSTDVTKLPSAEHRIVQHPADQVFRDHNGYRVLYTDESGLVREARYWDKGAEPCPDITLPMSMRGPCEPGQNLKVFKDLQPEERGFATSVQYRARGFALGSFWFDGVHAYTEIHLPNDEELSPGNETWGGKHKKHAPMLELK